MALIADVGGMFFGIIRAIGMLGMFVLIMIAWFPVYYYGIKYKMSVVVRERVGDDTAVYFTKAGIVRNKKRNRSEMLILKSKLNPFKYWNLPLLPDKFYHHTKRGKRFLEFYKVGELDTDLKPIPPLSPFHIGYRPTDIKIFDWVTQGLEKDARETRNQPDKMAKIAAIAVPMMLVTGLIFGFIYGLSTVKELQAGNLAIANSLTSWGDKVVAVEEAKAGIQTIEPATGDNTAAALLENVGIELG